MAKNKVISHLKGDIKTFKKEAHEDRELMKSLKHEKKECKKMGKKKAPKKRDKFEKVMHEYKEDTLRSGSKKGPLVKKPSQALAIAFSEQRRSKKRKK